jgi:hypothetical protein
LKPSLVVAVASSSDRDDAPAAMVREASVLSGAC